MTVSVPPNLLCLVSSVSRTQSLIQIACGRLPYFTDRRLLESRAINRLAFEGLRTLNLGVIRKTTPC
jgi:hypothetical protein